MCIAQDQIEPIYTRTQNDGLMHKSVATCAAIEFHPVVPSPDEESTFHAEGLKDAEVEYNSFHRAFT